MKKIVRKKKARKQAPSLVKKVFIKRDPLNAQDVERKEDKNSLDPIHEEMEHQD